MPSSERRRELKRRRHRRKKMAQLHRKLKNANTSERAEMAMKIRALTPGAEVVISNLALEEAQ